MQNRTESWQLYIQSRGPARLQEKCFKTIWERYHRRILFFIQNMIPDDAEDLLQEVMIKVYQNIRHFNPRYSFSTWIYTVARNHCINFMKKRRSQLINMSIQVNQRGQHQQKNDPEHQLIREEMNQKIDAVLSSFPPHLSQMAFLRFYEGMKYGDIAKIMNIPKGTVKSRLHSIRAKLKDALEYYYEN